MEDEIQANLASKNKPFRLYTLAYGETFLNLTIMPDTGESRGIVVVEDCLYTATKQRVVTQKKNEVTILKKEIEGKNAELQETNSQIDSLMKRIRTQNHELEMKVRKRTRELNNSRFKVITTLAQAAEFRDMETGGHIYRIGRSSVMLGKKHGLCAAECESLFYSALLHDLGKIGIPDSILLKPGQLTNQEWKLMREHTTIGAELLSNNEDPLFNSARDVALYHHEKWDGSGYPKGLAGEKIPLMARICAIVDVFDALLSVRPYKKSFSFDRTAHILQMGRGKHFDPSLVDSFMLVFDDMIRLQRETAEELEILLPDFEI